jgi:hypothetical protein
MTLDLALDLARALAAALFVVVAPGWFWSGLLAPAAGASRGGSPDRVERLVYSLALSLALVPAVALVPARFLGFGVTLPVAVLSALLVLAAGLAARLVYGRKEADDAPLLPRPPALGVPVLALLVLALGLALLATLAGPPDIQTASTIGVLVLFAAAACLIGSRRGPPAGDHNGEPEPPVGAFARWTGVLRWASLALVLALVLFRGYGGPVLHDWPFIRGVDQYSHAVMAEQMMVAGTYEDYLIYPPGFHTTTAMISRVSGLGPLEVFPVLAPALLALPPLALYALAKRLWGWKVGVAAALLVGLCVNGTYAFYNDAMYPNLVASQLLVVLSVAALVSLLARPTPRAALLLAILGSAVVLYHPLASLYLVLILAPVGLLLVPYLLRRDRVRGIALFLSLTTLFVLAVVQAWDTYDLPRAVAGLVPGGPGGGSTTGTAVGGAIGSQLPYGPQHLLGTLSPPVALLGLFGLLLLPVVLLRRPHDAPLAPRVPEISLALLVWWCLFLFAGSRTELSGFPQRFERDLVVPLALLGGFALVAILRSLGGGARGPAGAPARLPAVALAAVVATLGGAVIWQAARENLLVSAEPTPRVVVDEEVAAAGEWLREHNEGGNIMVGPSVNQVPSRIMLAYGGYTALQSFERAQVDRARDLPPQGPEPLLDVLYVMENPGTERARRLIEKHDVRYVVCYKRMPDRSFNPYGEGFEEEPGLYRTAFENGSVTIFAPRDTVQALLR